MHNPFLGNAFFEMSILKEVHILRYFRKNITSTKVPKWTLALVILKFQNEGVLNNASFFLIFFLFYLVSGGVFFPLMTHNQTFHNTIFIHKSTLEQNHREPDIYTNNHVTNVINSVRMTSNSQHRVDRKPETPVV